MLNRKIITPFASTLVALTILATNVFTSGVFAATTPAANGGNGYKISPVRTDLTLEPGKSQTLQIYVQNVSSVVENLQVVINDFQASNDESGNPALLLNGKNAAVHGLRQFITVPTQTLSLQPNEQKVVSVVIAMPTTVTAGGYYGAVRIAPASVNATNNVTLAASVASLILVKVPGDTKEQVSIASIGVESGTKQRSIFTSGKNLTAVVRFQNNGDVQEEPFGKIILKKGSTTTSYEINNTDPRGNVLPGSIRKFTVPLTKTSSFGKYTLQGNFGYGSNGQLLSASTTFYVIPVTAIVALIVIVALLLFAIFELPRLVKRYNRRVLRKAGRR